MSRFRTFYANSCQQHLGIFNVPSIQLSRLVEIIENPLMLYSFADFYLSFVRYEPRHEKTGFLHMQKKRRRSASW